MLKAHIVNGDGGKAVQREFTPLRKIKPRPFPQEKVRQKSFCQQLNAGSQVYHFRSPAGSGLTQELQFLRLSSKSVNVIIKRYFSR